MTYNLKKSIIQWESVGICICLRPRRGSFSAQCVVLIKQNILLTAATGWGWEAQIYFDGRIHTPTPYW